MTYTRLVRPDPLVEILEAARLAARAKVVGGVALRLLEAEAHEEILTLARMADAELDLVAHRETLFFPLVLVEVA